MNFKIKANKPLSLVAKAKGLTNWLNLLAFVKKLPYGRNKNRYDLSLVLKEEKGSCSSKHAFLCEVARENSIESVQLILGIYKMNSKNTNVPNTLKNFGLDFIPEAHCYLKINEERIDVTSEDTSFDKVKEAILYEEIILPNQVVEYKVALHKLFLKKWIIEENIPKTFDDVWLARESCIKYLSES